MLQDVRKERSCQDLQRDRSFCCLGIVASFGGIASLWVDTSAIQNAESTEQWDPSGWIGEHELTKFKDLVMITVKVNIGDEVWHREVIRRVTRPDEPREL